MTTPASERRGPGRPIDAELLERRRCEILEVAARQFAQLGYAATDMQQVADELGVGKGTIYRYFASKEELFLAAVDQGMQQLGTAIGEGTRNAKTVIETVELGVAAYLKYFDGHPDLIELVIQERASFRNRKAPTYFAHREANIGPWKQLFQQMIDDGLVRDVPVERITDVVSDLLYGTIFTNHFAKRKKSLASQCKDVLDILFSGLLVESRRGSDE